MDLVIIAALIGASSFALGFCAGYGIRAYISARRRRFSRSRRLLPLHQAPLLAPDVERIREDERKPAG